MPVFSCAAALLDPPPNVIPIILGSLSFRPITVREAYRAPYLPYRLKSAAHRVSRRAAHVTALAGRTFDRHRTIKVWGRPVLSLSTGESIVLEIIARTALSQGRGDTAVDRATVTGPAYLPM